MKKLVSILGSTGSIGLTTLKIIQTKKNYFTPYFFSANKNYKLICEQIKKYKPKYFLINDQKVYERIKNKFKNNKTIFINNIDEANFKKISDITVSAVPGIAGLYPTIAMIKKTKKLLIANKESVICGWQLISDLATKFKTKIIPVDSEHYSIFKLLENTKLANVEKIYLTASGGPFLGFSLNQLKKVMPKDALKHPKWKMGKKITIDSSTLVNKILEYIEAQKLFNISKDKLDILIHPESLVHAVIKFKNGLTKFIYHETSMIIPLANAIFDNNLMIDDYLNNNLNIKSLTFSKPNKINYPIINILSKANEFPSTSIIINASNEVLVDFFEKKGAFLGIVLIIKKILRDKNYKKYAIRKPKNLTQIDNINSWAKKTTIEKIKDTYE